MNSEDKLTNSPITLGTDPEVFLKTEQNSFFPAFGIIQGTKELPYEIIGPGFSTQVDNVMCEFNIPASKTKEDFSDNIQKVLNWLKENLPKNLSVEIQPSAEFEKHLLENDLAQVLGCSSDYDVYSGENTSIKSLGETNWRFAGGHVHVGYPDSNTITNENLVKWLDIYLGVPSVILDDDDKRKMYYGTPGRYREKTFGVEYRTLSNWWIKNDTYRKWVFEQCQKAYYAVINEVLIGESFERQVRECIQSNNREQAEKLMTHFNVMSNEEFNNLINLKINDYINA